MLDVFGFCSSTSWSWPLGTKSVSLQCEHSVCMVLSSLLLLNTMRIASEVLRVFAVHALAVESVVVDVSVVVSVSCCSQNWFAHSRWSMLAGAASVLAVSIPSACLASQYSLAACCLCLFDIARGFVFFFFGFGCMNLAMKASWVSFGENVGESGVRVGAGLTAATVAGAGWLLLRFPSFPNFEITYRFHSFLSLTIFSKSEKLWWAGASISRFPPSPISCWTLTAILTRRSSSSPAAFFIFFVRSRCPSQDNLLRRMSLQRE